MLIKNGMIINPAAGQSCAADILIKDGVIQDIADNIAPSGSEEVILSLIHISEPTRP